MKPRNAKLKMVLLAGATLCSAGAWALPPLGAQSVTRTETVKYHPAQAETMEGATHLYQELKAAAMRVCADQQHAPVRDLSQAESSHAACMQEALDKAVKRVGIPMVAVVHQYGVPTATLARR